jgi:hypothetical protein
MGSRRLSMTDACAVTAVLVVQAIIHRRPHASLAVQGDRVGNVKSATDGADAPDVAVSRRPFKRQLFDSLGDPSKGALSLLCISVLSFLAVMGASGWAARAGVLPPSNDFRTNLLAAEVTLVPTATAVAYCRIFLKASAINVVLILGVFVSTLNQALLASIPSYRHAEADAEVVSEFLVAATILALSIVMYRTSLHRHRIRNLPAGDQVSAATFWLLSTWTFYTALHSAPGWDRVAYTAVAALLVGWLTVLLCAASVQAGCWLQSGLDTLPENEALSRGRRLSVMLMTRLAVVYKDPSTALAVVIGCASASIVASEEGSRGISAPLTIGLIAVVLPLWPFERLRSRDAVITHSIR